MLERIRLGCRTLLPALRERLSAFWSKYKYIHIALPQSSTYLFSNRRKTATQCRVVTWEVRGRKSEQVDRSICESRCTRLRLNNSTPQPWWRFAKIPAANCPEGCTERDWRHKTWKKIIRRESTHEISEDHMTPNSIFNAQPDIYIVGSVWRRAFIAISWLVTRIWFLIFKSSKAQKNYDNFWNNSDHGSVSRIPVTSPGQDHTCIHPGSRPGNFSLAWTDRQIGSKCMATMGDTRPEAHSVDTRCKHGACTSQHTC